MNEKQTPDIERNFESQEFNAAMEDVFEALDQSELPTEVGTDVPDGVPLSAIAGHRLVLVEDALRVDKIVKERIAARVDLLIRSVCQTLASKPTAAMSEQGRIVAIIAGSSSLLDELSRNNTKGTDANQEEVDRKVILLCCQLIHLAVGGDITLGYEPPLSPKQDEDSDLDSDGYEE